MILPPSAGSSSTANSPLSRRTRRNSPIRSSLTRALMTCRHYTFGMGAIVKSQLADGIAILTLDHPEKRNALSREMLSQLGAALDRIAADHGVRVVIIRGHGPAFSAGHDLRELTGGDEVAYAALFALCTDVME